jgi:hypothetical protein
LTFNSKNGDAKQQSVHRFWIDPQRSYIVMQYEKLSGQPLSVTSRRTIKELEKSPSGIWYPTLVSHTDFYVEKNGEPGVVEHLSRHYLDFETEFPAGVFEPKALPDTP